MHSRESICLEMNFGFSLTQKAYKDMLKNSHYLLIYHMAHTSNSCAIDSLQNFHFSDYQNMMIGREYF